MTNSIASTWKIDQGHSNVSFKVKHLAIAHVQGTFNSFEGSIKTTDNDFNGAEINLSIEADSLSTNNKDRDAHLQSDMFFDVQQFPNLSFTGRLHKTTHNEYELSGDLTIRNVTQPMKLDAEFIGMGQGRFGDVRAGFKLNGKLNRKDFGLTWNMLTEAGGLMLGENIRLHMDIELIKV